MSEAAEQFTIGNLTFDSKRISSQQDVKELNPAEFKILKHFAGSGSRIIPLEEFAEILAYDSNAEKTDSKQTAPYLQHFKDLASTSLFHVGKMLAKLSDQSISVKHVENVGYQLRKKDPRVPGDEDNARKAISIEFDRYIDQFEASLSRIFSAEPWALAATLRSDPAIMMLLFDQAMQIDDAIDNHLVQRRIERNSKEVKRAEYYFGLFNIVDAMVNIVSDTLGAIRSKDRYNIYTDKISRVVIYDENEQPLFPEKEEGLDVIQRTGIHFLRVYTVWCEVCRLWQLPSFKSDTDNFEVDLGACEMAITYFASVLDRDALLISQYKHHYYPDGNTNSDEFGRLLEWLLSSIKVMDDILLHSRLLLIRKKAESIELKNDEESFLENFFIRAFSSEPGVRH